MTAQKYARQIMLPQLGGAGQKKLAQAKVLLVGAGGLAAGAVPWLTGAGVGTIGIIDDDVVEESNLARQILFTEQDIGKPKAPLLAQWGRAQNSDCTFTPLQSRLAPDNALASIGDYDIIADGSDNFATRFLLNDACFFAKKVLVSAALGEWQGQLTTLKAFAKSPTGEPYPCYRSLVPDIAEPANSAPCAGLPVLGALAGIMGGLLAMEIIKELVGFGQSLAGQLLLYDALTTRTRLVKIPYDPANPLNGANPQWHDLSHHSC